MAHKDKNIINKDNTTDLQSAGYLEIKASKVTQ